MMSVGATPMTNAATAIRPPLITSTSRNDTTERTFARLKAANVDPMAGDDNTSPRSRAPRPNSCSRWSGSAVRNTPKITMKRKNPATTTARMIGVLMTSAAPRS